MAAEEVTMVLMYHGCFGLLYSVENMLAPINRHDIFEDDRIKRCNIRSLMDSFVVAVLYS